MKKALIKLGLVTAISTSLLGFTYEIKDGWQQLGAIEDIEDMTIFNNAGCVDHVWYYDNNDTSNPNWKLHIADGNTYNYCGETLDSLKKGQGFWVKATGDCTIEIDEPNCNPLGMPIPPSPDSCDINGTNPDNNGTVTHNGFIYGEVVSPNTGRTWLDRNLGASQVCTSMNDSACFGDYYQWGREADGHEKKDSATTTVKATDITNVGSSFITGSGDWSTIDADASLRAANWSKTDGSSICPIGYRVPTIDEITTETISNLVNSQDLFNSFLKLAEGYHREINGTLITSGGPNLGGVLWSTSLSSNIQAWNFSYTPNTSIYTDVFLYGYNVRCIKD